MSDNNRVCLGAIVGVHGIKGELKLKSFTEIPEDIDQYGDLEDQTATRKFKIKVVGQSKELLRIKIKGVDDRNAAEALVGTQFFVSRDILPELEEEEFYHADLIGLKVLPSLSLRGGKADAAIPAESIGTVAGIYNFGSGDIIDIKIDGKSEMIPFNKEYVPEVNIKKGYIIISSASLNFAEDKSNEG